MLDFFEEEVRSLLLLILHCLESLKESSDIFWLVDRDSKGFALSKDVSIEIDE